MRQSRWERRPSLALVAETHLFCGFGNLLPLLAIFCGFSQSGSPRCYTNILALKPLTLHAKPLIPWAYIPRVLAPNRAPLSTCFGAQVLLDANADVLAVTDNFKMTPLHWAATCGSTVRAALACLHSRASRHATSTWPRDII
eukprot:4924046-Pleurochrysis_carterae.AAC.2